MSILKKQNSTVNLKEQILLFIGIFLLISATVIALFLSWYLGQSKLEFANYQAQELNSLELYQHDIANEYNSVLADLNILSSLPQMQNDKNNDKVKRELQLIYQKFAEMRHRYNQIRYLDNDGNELIRVNYNQGQVYVVPDHELQKKQHRYYVEDIKQLEAEQIYISPFDLNIEHKVIEEPYRPMIRLGKRLFDANHQPNGMLIINYEGKYLLKTLEHGHQILSEKAKLMLLNQDGYWLKASDPKLEWGFMFSHKKDLTYKVLYPDVWQAMSENNAGQYENKDGLYTFEKFDPLNPSDKKEPHNLHKLISTVGHQNATWILVSHLPQDDYHAQTNQTVQDNLLYLLILAIGSVLVSFLLTRYQYEQYKLVNRNKFLATHDPLTGLHNRTALDQELPLRLSEASKNDKCCCVYYIDLDHFKPVNDNFGHDVGDEVLKIVATRLRGVIRKHSDMVIRLGGDEIMVLACNLDDPKKKAIFGSKLMSIFKDPMNAKGHTFKIGATIGCACYPNDSGEIDKLIKMADTALYHAKHQNKGSLKIYSELSLEERKLVNDIEQMKL
ncbi:GGDEF domain-containing protein [uncultured Thiomicrorhabdus sp.]